jgi:cysteinyl-tRNA synthetase
MYVCGPTVYDYCHIGHARSYVVFDSLRRFIEASGYKVRLVQNFTDLEDSIARKSEQMGISQMEVADKFIGEFFTDMDSLDIKRAQKYPRVSEHIDEIIEMVKAFVDGGCAYLSGDRIYFDAAHCGATVEDIRDMLASPIPPDPTKRSPMDFLIWQGCTKEPCWDSPWGKGRPGWHIECAVMATKYLGPFFDVHGGGVDLIFPHHTYEAMLGREFYGTEYARIFMHNGFIYNSGRKMSKSLGNVIKIRELMKTRTKDQVRFFLLGSHYKSNMAYTDAEMEARVKEYGDLRRFVTSLENGGDVNADDVEQLQLEFMRSLCDDFDTGKATKTLLELPKMGNRMTPSAQERLGAFLKEVEDIFGYKII